MQELIEYIAKALVEDPEQVVVKEVAGRQNHFELKVAEADRGKVIGRKGRTAHALRVLLVAACGDREATLDIVD